jgi:hypothetical protein
MPNSHTNAYSRSRRSGSNASVVSSKSALVSMFKNSTGADMRRSRSVSVRVSEQLRVAPLVALSNELQKRIAFALAKLTWKRKIRSADLRLPNRDRAACV